MFLAFDTHYTTNKAHTACVAFHAWEDAQPHAVHTEMREGVEAYTPGQFYKRELPCILSLLKKIDTQTLQAIIIDGYVFVDDNGKPGLGGHLYEALNRLVPVIGVAKTNFFSVEKLKSPLLRGRSLVPLYITAAGMDTDEAATQIGKMHGAYRIPTLLKLADSRSRNQTVFC